MKRGVILPNTENFEAGQMLTGPRGGCEDQLPATGTRKGIAECNKTFKLSPTTTVNIAAVFTVTKGNCPSDKAHFVKQV